MNDAPAARRHGTVAQRAAWAGLYAYEAPACAARVDDIAIDLQ